MTVAATSTPSTFHPGLRRAVGTTAHGWNQLGRQIQFCAETIAGSAQAVTRYPSELLRLIAEMSLGVGALALIGGAVCIIGFLTSAAGSTIAIQLYPQLQQVGVDALAGFTSAILNTRFLGPLIAGIGLAATIGAGATAQLGAMRINEEIDALEAMAIRGVAYLCSTRLVAGIIVVIPLYTVGVLLAYITTRFGTTTVYGQASGVYDHYFYTFLNPTDLLWSFLQALVVGAVVMLVHTYYGFTATGGPAGVGDAVGRAVRTSLVTLVIVTLLVSLAIYGPNGHFNFSG
ncbi:ABC transporter permease [Mycobacterium florentinum]|uniref:ABC transporter permease n=1 Tax=Mycobacterium florentinum TaxID=292462 RepID=A0A1X1TUI3_MYCFL|nr:ABC transporter permease [Mycobacterium florentinum]MCV7408514.1 ABC transporter permease [Mycobacterium florentinum]ORV48038.1 ABC transporter permease [Mycobacterium florentinum]BBX77985.1 ABC transporter permease [Mycobacterium florentinum]